MWAYFAQKWKKRTHISLSPRVPGIHNDWSLHPYIFSTILEIPISIPHFVYSGNNYAHLENTALNDEKKKQTHALPIWHKRKTDVDPQKACLQVQIEEFLWLMQVSTDNHMKMQNTSWDIQMFGKTMQMICTWCNFFSVMGLRSWSIGKKVM